MNVVRSSVSMPVQRPQQQQQQEDDPMAWLRPVGTVASMFGFPYISMAMGAYDAINGNPNGMLGMLGAGGGNNPFLNMLRQPGGLPGGSFGADNAFGDFGWGGA